jgi:hypothetical protein
MLPSFCDGNINWIWRMSLTSEWTVAASFSLLVIRRGLITTSLWALKNNIELYIVSYQLAINLVSKHLGFLFKD